MNTNLSAYLVASDVVDWQHPSILELANEIGHRHDSVNAVAQACFEWVRDEIRHSVDYQMNPVTCRASAVLHHRTGYCYAKSHLLAALLRANDIPTGFCYQRLRIDDQGAPFSLHGFNAVHLPDIGWYRLDARGNRTGVNAQFVPPQEQLAFPIQFPDEATFPAILPEPLPVIVAALNAQTTWDDMLANLPDVNLAEAEQWGLMGGTT